MTQFKSLFMALVIGCSVSMYAPKSQALIVLYGSGLHTTQNNINDIVEDLAKAVGCILILPICLLDQPQTGVPAITTQDLMDQGVSEAKAQSIVSEFKTLSRDAQAKKTGLTVSKTDTVESLISDLGTISPNLSPEFKYFYATQVLLAK